jgi:hypothetical protein
MDVRPRNNFLEQLERRRSQEQASQAETEAPKRSSVEEMTDEELDAALGQAKRDLLDARHEELKEVLTSKVESEAPVDKGGASSASLAAVLGNLKRASRRRRRRTR